MRNGEIKTDFPPLDMRSRREAVDLLADKLQGAELTEEQAKLLHACEVMGGVATTETVRCAAVSEEEVADNFSFPPISNPLNVLVKDTSK